jgi:hypothetical protein
MDPMTPKIKWMTTLQVGDVVCDCRYKHISIKELSPCYLPWYPKLLQKLIFSLPDPVFDIIDRVWCFVMRKLHITSLVDKDLILEDGSHCSAMSCCDNSNHEWKHPSSSEEMDKK